MTASSPIRVLVVDDSEFFAEMTAETLAEDHDFEATATASAEDGLAALAEQPFDCIVSDYQMPGLDGLEFLDRVREAYEDIPFILLTGRGDEEVASRAIAAGVADYLLKLEVVEDQQYERLANRIESVVEQHRTERKYERLVDNTPDAIAQVTSEGRLVAANPALAAVLDRDRESLLGEHLTEVLPADVAEARIETGREVIETGETARTEDGHDGRIFHNIVTPIDVRTGEQTFQIISRDITERKERERELHRQNERLEQFASVVSHDLRNPLTVAESALEFLDGEDEHVERMERSLTRMNHIIEDVLELARQGRAVDDPRPAALDRLVEDAWSQIDREGLSLGAVPEGRIEADPERVQAMLENLFRNAGEHAKPAAVPGPDTDGGSVTVDVGVLDDGDGFYVADDGPGIPEADRSAVFDPGYSTSEAGTGLGLAIVEQIAAAHGWEVEVTDADTGGARFEIGGVPLQ